MTVKLPLAEASTIADYFVDQIRGACRRVEIVGSVRRARRRVKDIEVLCIDRLDFEPGDKDLFGDEGPGSWSSRLHRRITELSEDGQRILPIKPSAPEPEDGVSWEPDRLWAEKGSWAEGKDAPGYFRLWIPSRRIRVDVFMVTRLTWGVAQLIRTGSSDFSRAFVQHWTRVSGGGRVALNRLHPKVLTEAEAVAFHDATQTWLGEPLDTPEERDVFEAGRLSWVEPRDRRLAADLEHAAETWRPARSRAAKTSSRARASSPAAGVSA